MCCFNFADTLTCLLAVAGASSRLVTVAFWLTVALRAHLQCSDICEYKTTTALNVLHITSRSFILPAGNTGVG